MQEVQVSLTVPASAIGAGLLRAAAVELERLGGANGAARSNGATAATDEAAVTDKPRRGRKSNAQKEAEAAAAAKAAKGDDDDFETDTEEESEDDLDFGDEPAKSEKKKLTLDGNIIPAFKEFVSRHGEDGRTKAGEILAKFKVKSVRDLPEEKYTDVMKLLKA